jgi:2-hydroxy-3-keto-5-methylthiopentenyl-1-phosphate phosphatase
MARTDPAWRGVLVTDFDGTLTSVDFFELVRERWPLVPDPWEACVAGRVPHIIAIAQVFAAARGPESGLLELIDRLGIDPAAGAAFRALRTAGWRVVVASAGCDWYIRKVLERLGVEADVHANPGRYDEHRGLLMEPPHGSPFQHPRFGLDKAAVLRHYAAGGLPMAFAGDGTPDLAPALLVPPERRFARAWLANTLAARGETFQPFARWPEIADRLLATTAA